MENTKFVVFSHGRAGTNFLINNIKQHPRLAVFHEPFHNNEKDRTLVNGKKWIEGTSSADFAYNNIYNSVNAEKSSAGFKLFYFHCRQNILSSDIWTRLANDKSVKIIFLNRRNLLNKHLSDLRAHASGVWHPNKCNYLEEQYSEVVSIQVSVNQCLRVMADIFSGYTIIKDKFRNHQFIEFFFEDLENKSEEFLDNVYNFLNVVPVEMKIPFRAKTLSRATTMISNEEEVRSVIGSSFFSDFINDCPLLI